MLVKLSAPGLKALAPTSETSFIGVVWTGESAPPTADTEKLILLSDGATRGIADGFRARLVRDRPSEIKGRDVYLLGSDHAYLSTGDVVRIEPRRGELSALYRAKSRSNSLLVTERCDNRCVMCSQPPKARDDGWLVDELLEAIPLISSSATEIGITGGEPGLLGGRLLDLVRSLRDHLPSTAVHVLSNGRRFSDPRFARGLGALRHHDLMVGVPVYSDLAEEHDYVVQARGAFDETVRGILELKRAGVRVEVRFVMHRETVGRLPEFARFVARNLTFVDHVALMGLELVGYARSNLDALWIDPVDYQPPLVKAALALHRAGLSVSIYNHTLCTLDEALHPFARKSISDWKNVYVDACTRCDLRERCGGFFASSTVRRSRGIAPFHAR